MGVALEDHRRRAVETVQEDEDALRRPKALSREAHGVVRLKGIAGEGHRRIQREQQDRGGRQRLALAAHEQEGVGPHGPEGHLHRALADPAPAIGLHGGHGLATHAIPVDVDRFARAKAVEGKHDHVPRLGHLGAQFHLGHTPRDGADRLGYLCAIALLG